MARHTIIAEAVIATLQATTRVNLASSVGNGSNKHFIIVHNPKKFNPYTFEVESIINGTLHHWSSTEIADMVERYNLLP